MDKVTIIPNQLERDLLDRALEKFSSLDDLPQSVLAAELVVLGDQIRITHALVLW
jgi:hypothetical protein